MGRTSMDAARRTSGTSKLFSAFSKKPSDSSLSVPADLDPLEIEGMQKLAEYKVKKVLGEGASAEVKEVIHIETGVHYALKCIKKNKIPGFKRELSRGKILREMTILAPINHPNIVKVFDTFQDYDYYYLVLELCTGGVIFDRIHGIVNHTKSFTNRITEKDVAEIVFSMFDAIACLHENDIIHRDLKPENLMFKSKAKDSLITIMDFGVANHVRGDELLKSAVVGTPRYSAPEILLERGHGKPSDVWSVGCLTYALLSGFSPFHQATTLAQMKSAVANFKPTFHPLYWLTKDLISSCLQVDPLNRPTARQAQMHPWFISFVPNARDIAKAVLALPEEHTPPLLGSSPAVRIFSNNGKHTVKFRLGGAHDEFSFDEDDENSDDEKEEISTAVTDESSAVLSALSNRFEEPPDDLPIMVREFSSEDLVAMVAQNVPRPLLELGLENPTPDATIMLPNLVDSWDAARKDLGDLEYGNKVLSENTSRASEDCSERPSLESQSTEAQLNAVTQKLEDIAKRESSISSKTSSKSNKSEPVEIPVSDKKDSKGLFGFKFGK
ncbi:hypothetical protein HK098_003822 [Nowakowskiella sp. JEL0407]|nr:hypothetical protein HK098_003822 [Nowakowskiella sp. JEL0407]